MRRQEQLSCVLTVQQKRFLERESERQDRLIANLIRRYIDDQIRQAEGSEAAA